MRRIILVLSFILCLGSAIFAQSAALKQANVMYTNGNYSDAAAMYTKILATEGVAPELYYNLGNAYYKLNETAKAILNYERALRIDPLYDDARNNLELAQLKVVDNVAPTPTFFVGRWIENLMKLLSSNQWIFVSLAAFVAFLVLAFLFVFAPSLLLRKLSFYVGMTFFAFSVTTFVFSGVRKNQLVGHRDAIVMTGVVTVKSSPDKSGTDLFQLHEGTKVQVKSTLGKWTEIVLGNGNIGWVEQVDIENI
jgi:FOG: TPR repeat